MPNPIPGPYGVTTAIQEILQRKRDEQRQAMLDRLEAEKVQRQEADKQRNYELAQQSEARAKSVADAQIAASNEEMETARLGRLPYGRMEITPDYKTQNNDLYEVMAKNMMLEREPDETTVAYQLPADAPFDPLLQQNADTGSEPPPSDDQLFDTNRATRVETKIPGKEFYRGSKEFQEQAIARKRLEDFLANNRDLPEHVVRGMRVSIAGAPGQVAGEAAKPKPRVSTVSHTGVVSPSQEREYGTDFIELNPPPQAPAGVSVPQRMIFPNPQDGNRPWVYWMKPGDTINKGTPIAPYVPGETGMFGAIKPEQNTDIVDARISGDLQSARTATGPDRDIRIQQGQANVAAHARGLTPDAHDFLVQATDRIIARVKEGKPAPKVDQVMADVETNIPNIDPKTYNRLYRLFLMILAGEEQ